MADKKKVTPLNVPKVQRGVKEALTPGEKQEPEQTPLEKVIGRELTKIVEDINFDAKFESIKTAIEAKQSENLLPILEKINDKLNPILGALYGVSNVNDNTNPSALLSKLGNLDPKLTTFGPLNSMLQQIYDLLSYQINNKSSYKLEDLAIAVSAEISKFLKEIDNRPALESISKTLEDMKSSILSNNSAENINRVYSQLEAINTILSSNKTIDYNIAISDIASKISNLVNVINNKSIEQQDNSSLLEILNGIANAVQTMSNSNVENISQSTNLLKEISNKLDLINTENTIVDNSVIVSELENIKQVLADNISANYTEKPKFIDYTDALTAINDSIKNIVASNSNIQNVENNSEINSTTINELKTLSESITNLTSSVVNNNSTITELQNINNSISELNSLITNNSSISEITNKLTEITEKLSVENINTSISSIKETVNILSSSISNISNISSYISSVNENVTKLTRIVSENTQNFTDNIRQSIIEQISSMTENINSVNNAIEKVTNVESTTIKLVENISTSITQLSDIISNFTDNLTTNNISRIENIATSIKDSISTIITENNSNISSTFNNFTQSIQTSIESIATNLSNLTNIDNSSIVSEVTNTLSTVSNTLNSLTSNITELTNVSNSNITSITDSISNISNSISTAVESVSNIDKSVSTSISTINDSINNVNVQIQKMLNNSVSNVLNSVSTSINNVSEKINSSLGVTLESIASNISIISNAISSSNKQIEVKEYDSIIESINDNTNSIIDSISENFGEISSYISKIIRIEDFNLRTAQIIDAINIDKSKSIIDAINSLKSIYGQESSSINTTALDYNINIKADGLDKETVEALIDFSKIDTESVEYINNLNNIVAGLSSLEVLNTLNLDNENINAVIEVIDTLNSINVNAESFDPFTIDCIKYFIDNLSTLDMAKLNQFNENSLESISIITDTLRSFSNLKLDNFNKNIQSLDVNQFVTLLDRLKDIPVYDKEDKTTMTAISDLLSAISSISGFDSKKFEDLSTNLRKMIRLTEKPTIFTKLKISDRGLIHILMHNIGEIASETEQTFDNTKNIGKMLNLINGIAQFDAKSFENLKYISYILAVVTSKDDPYLYKAFYNIREIGNLINGWDEKSSPVVLISNQLKLINNLAAKMSFKNIAELSIKSVIAWQAMYSLVKMFNYLKEVATISENVEDYITTINNALLKINSIDIDKLSHLDKAIKSMIASSYYLAAFVAIPKKEIDITKNVNLLNTAINQINNIAILKDLNNLKSITEGLKYLSKVNSTLAIVGATLPLAYLGIIAINTEIDMLNKIVGKLNKGIPDIDKNVEKRLKSLATVVVAASGMLLFGAFIGGYVLAHLGDVLGFTATLGLFILTTVGAFNLATRRINEAKFNAEEFGKLLLISGSIILLGGSIMTLYAPLVLGALGFSVALGLFIFSTVGAFNLATKGIDSSMQAAEKFVVLIGVASSALLIGGALFTLFPWLMATTLLFGAYLTAFVCGVTYLFNLAGGLMDDALAGAEKFAKLITIASVSLLAGGALFALYPWMMATTLLFGAYLAAFVVGTTFLFNMVGGQLDEAVSSAEKFAILIGISAISLCVGGFLFQQFPWMMATTLLFGVYLAAFVGAVTFTYGFASKFIERAEIDALNFAKIVGISAATMLIGGLFMLIPGMSLATLAFTGLFILFMSTTLLAYSISSKSIQNAKETALGFGVVVLLTSAALLIGGGLLLAYPGLGETCLEFAGLTALFVTIFGVSIWALSKIDTKSLTIGEIALAGIAVLIAGFGYAFTYVAESAKLLEQVNDPIKQLAIMGGVIVAIGTTVAILGALSSNPAVALALAVGAAVLAGIELLIFGMGKAMSCIAQSMNDLDKVKDFKAAQVKKAIEEYVSIIPALTPMANPILAIKMAIISRSVSAMSKAIIDISTGVKTACDLKTSDGRNLTPSDFTLAAQNVKSVVTILGRSLMDVYKENKEMFSAGTIGDLLGMDTPFSRVSKSCATMGQLITDISAGVKDFADLKMPIYDDNGQLKGYRTMTDADFENAAKSVAKVVTCLGGALIEVYNSNPEMFTDPSIWHTSADKTPFGMVAKATSGLGALIKDSAIGIKEIAGLEVNYKDLEGKDGKVSKIISILANSIMDVYNSNPKLFTDDSFWHTNPQKTPFGMVMQCLNTLAPFVKNAASSINDINKLDFKASDLATNGEVYLKTNRLIGVIPKAIIDLMNSSYGKYLTDDDYIETYSNMANMYKYFKNIVSNAASAYNEIIKLDFKGSSVDVLNLSIYKMLKALPESIIGELNRHKDFYANTSSLDSAVNAFKQYNNLINYVTKAYDNVIRSLDKIGVSGNDTTIIDIITTNLNTLVTKLADAIKLDTIKLDEASVNTFADNVAKYSSTIELLAKSYSLVPEDLTKYDNVVKAIEGVNFKISEIQNLEAFEREQQVLEKYIITLNNLDLTKVEALSNLMSVMNELATKLGALDNFTSALNDKISITLNNLAKQIKDSGDIITKADTLQKQRHEAIKSSIKEIQTIMDQKLIVEVNHNEIQSNGGDFFTDAYDSGSNINNYDNQNIQQNSPSLFDRAKNSISDMFGGNNNSQQPTQQQNVVNRNVGGIDYDRLRTVIMEAITQASGSGIDINRR